MVDEVSLEQELDEERLDVAPDDARDIEGDDDVADYEAETPLNFWENKQRDIVTSVVDYNLASLASLVTSQSIDLSPRYQRRHRWKGQRQSQLIESFLMNVPVPPIFLNEDAYGKYSVIDGKQRLQAIHEFLRGRLRLQGLKVFTEVNNKTFDDLPSELQAVIQTRAVLRAVIVLRQSDTDIKFEVFRRLNTGGVRLNPQEIRNSTYPGPLNDLILELSESQTFRRLLGVKDERSSAIVREMRDAEFVLRYFTFADTYATFTGGMMRQMDRFMAANQHMDASGLGKLRERFLRTLSLVEAAFGAHAFRRWSPERATWRDQVVASLFDAEMFGVEGGVADDLRSRQDAIIAGVQHLFSDADFRKSIDAATNTPALFRARIASVQGVITAALE